MKVLAQCTAPATTVCRQLSSSSRISSASCLRVVPSRPFAVTKPQGTTVRTMALFGGGSSKATATDIYNISTKTIDGKDLALSAYKGKVLLIVNVASQCGFTPQYTDMAELYNKYKSKGLEIIAQPCNQFGGQEPGSGSEIKAFASRKGATFTLLEKADVNGAAATPLFSYLKKEKGGLLGDDIKWNFTKFLVNRDGKVVKRYPSTTTPQAIEKDIQALL